MPISGIVITCTEQDGATIARDIGELQGVEVHGVLPGGRIVAVLEADDIQGEVDLVSRMHQMEGIASVCVAYHHFEDL